MKNSFIHFELILSALFWGLTFNAAKLISNSIPAFTIASYRFIIAGILMLVFLVFQKNLGNTIKKNLFPFLLMSIAGVVGFNAFFFLGMEYTSPTNGALIMATNPLVTALIASLFLKEPISKKHKLGTLISFCGVAWLILSGAKKSIVNVNIGDLYVLGGNVSMALYSIFNKRYVKDSSPLVTTGVTTILGAFILTLVSMTIDHTTKFYELPSHTYLSLIFMGACGSVLAYIFWNRGIKSIGVADTSIFFHLVPVFTVIGSLVFGQYISAQQILSGIVVVFGVMISSGAINKITNKVSAVTA